MRNRTPDRVRRRAGFTLLEVLIVVAIIVVLVGLTSVYVMRYLDDAKKDAAWVKATQLATVLSAYHTSKGDYPASLDVLLQPGDGGKPYLMPEQLVDPWGKTFQFDPAGPNNNGLRPDVWTQSPDGQTIGNWTKK